MIVVVEELRRKRKLRQKKCGNTQKSFFSCTSFSPLFYFFLTVILWSWFFGRFSAILIRFVHTQDERRDRIGVKSSDFQLSSSQSETFSKLFLQKTPMKFFSHTFALDSACISLRGGEWNWKTQFWEKLFSFCWLTVPSPRRRFFLNVVCAHPSCAVDGGWRWDWVEPREKQNTQSTLDETDWPPIMQRLFTERREREKFGRNELPSQLSAIFAGKFSMSWTWERTFILFSARKRERGKLPHLNHFSRQARELCRHEISDSSCAASHRSIRKKMKRFDKNTGNRKRTKAFRVSKYINFYLSLKMCSYMFSGLISSRHMTLWKFILYRSGESTLFRPKLCHKLSSQVCESLSSGKFRFQLYTVTRPRLPANTALVAAAAACSSKINYQHK